MKTEPYRYKCSAGETFDGVAMTLFKDERKAAELLMVNPEFSFTMRFGGGELLRVPVIDEAEVLPVSVPWKEG